MKRSPVVLALLALGAPPAAAEDPPFVRDQVTFGVSRATRVDNDRMTAVLVATHESASAAEAASRVNEAMGWALEQIGEDPAVEHRTGGYQTRQVHTPPPTRQERWRVEQELVLASGDFARVRELVTTLQSRLQLRSLGFFLSQERRIAAQREVTVEALGAFRAEARLIREALGFEGYQLVELHVSSGPVPGPRPRPRALAAEAGVPEPVALEAGWSEVQVRVDARIQLE